MKSALSFLEGGPTGNTGFAAMEGGLLPLERLGPERIFEHVSLYLNALEAEIVELGFQSKRSIRAERRSGILSLSPPPGFKAGVLAERITAQGVAVSSPDGLLRFAPHFANALSEVPAVVDATREALTPRPSQPG
jgi:hypothetical protein